MPSWAKLFLLLLSWLNGGVITVVKPISLGYSPGAFILMMLPATVMCPPSLLVILSRKSPLLSLAAVSPDTCAGVYTWDTGRCAAQRCANMKRHIRIIDALVISISALHGIRDSGPIRYKTRGRKAITALFLLSTAQWRSQERSGSSFQLARY